MFQFRDGDHLQWSTDQRSMVSSGANSSHQLFGTPGSHTSSADFCQTEIRHHNSPGVAYIKRMGGTTSPMLSRLTKDLWLWCMERNIMLQAQHLPGVLNSIADRESRTWSDRSEWRLSKTLFQRNQSLAGASLNRPVCEQVVSSAGSQTHWQ